MSVLCPIAVYLTKLSIFDSLHVNEAITFVHVFFSSSLNQAAHDQDMCEILVAVVKY